MRILGFSIQRYKWNSGKRIGWGESTGGTRILGLPFDIKVWFLFWRKL